MFRIMNKLMAFAILLTFVVQSTDIGYLPLSVKGNHDTLRTMMTVVSDNRVTAELSDLLSVNKAKPVEFNILTSSTIKSSSAGKVNITFRRNIDDEATSLLIDKVAKLLKNKTPLSSINDYINYQLNKNVLPSLVKVGANYLILVKMRRDAPRVFTPVFIGYDDYQQASDLSWLELAAFLSPMVVKDKEVNKEWEAFVTKEEFEKLYGIQWKWDYAAYDVNMMPLGSEGSKYLKKLPYDNAPGNSRIYYTTKKDFFYAVEEGSGVVRKFNKDGDKLPIERYEYDKISSEYVDSGKELLELINLPENKRGLSKAYDYLIDSNRGFRFLAPEEGFIYVAKVGDSAIRQIDLTTGEIDVMSTPDEKVLDFVKKDDFLYVVALKDSSPMIKKVDIKQKMTHNIPSFKSEEFEQAKRDAGLEILDLGDSVIIMDFNPESNKVRLAEYNKAPTKLITEHIGKPSRSLKSSSAGISVEVSRIPALLKDMEIDLQMDICLTLKDALKSGDLWDKLFAAIAFSSFDKDTISPYIDQIIPVLEYALKSGGLWDKLFAAIAFSGFDKDTISPYIDQIIPVLEYALKSGGLWDKLLAVTACSSFDKDTIFPYINQIIPVLKDALKNGDLWDKLFAAIAFSGFDKDTISPYIDQIIPVLEDALKNGDPRDKLFAAIAFSSFDKDTISPYIDQIISVLKDALKNGDPRDKLFAVAGLLTLSKGEPPFIKININYTGLNQPHTILAKDITELSQKLNKGVLNPLDILSSVLSETEMKLKTAVNGKWMVRIADITKEQSLEKALLSVIAAKAFAITDSSADSKASLKSSSAGRSVKEANQMIEAAIGSLLNIANVSELTYDGVKNVKNEIEEQQLALNEMSYHIFIDATSPFTATIKSRKRAEQIVKTMNLPFELSGLMAQESEVNGILTRVAQKKIGGILIDDEATDMSQEQKTLLLSLYGKGSPVLAALEEKLKVKIILSSQYILEDSMPNMIAISSREMEKAPGIMRINVVIDDNINSFIPIGPNLILAQQLLLYNLDGFSNEIIRKQISDIYRVIARQPMTDATIEAFVNTGIFTLKLPPVVPVDKNYYTELEKISAYTLIAA